MLTERAQSRRTSMAAANGLSRRRQRSTTIREAHAVEEDIQMEVQDTVRLSDRVNKRDSDRCIDREISNHKKMQSNRRRREDRLRAGEEGSTEGSVATDEDDDFEIDERRVAANTTTSFCSSSANPNSRKSLPPTTRLLVKQAPALKPAEELIGALVPRKARSASVKRSHASWLSSENGGLTESDSPSTSNVSVRKKMKPNGPKTRLPKVVKCSSSSDQQEDIEIEIAEVLFGLMKQSQNSKMAVDDNDKTSKLESEEGKGIISQDTKSSVSVLSFNTSLSSDRLPDDAAPKKKKVVADISASVSTSLKIDSKVETSALKSEQNTLPEMAYPGAAASFPVELQEVVITQNDSKLLIETSGGLGGCETEKRSVSAKEEDASCFQDSTVTTVTSMTLENKSLKEEFKIDIMVPPPMVTSPEAERDGFNDLTSNTSLEANDVKMKSLVVDEQKTDRFPKKELAVEEVKEKKIETIGEEPQLNIGLEMPNEDYGRDFSVKLRRQNLKQQQLQSIDTNAQVKITESSSCPLRTSVAGWTNCLQPLGSMTTFQMISPVDGSSRSAPGQQPPTYVSLPRPKRCATHCYIAHNIYLNQQHKKMNPLWSTGAGSTSCVTKPNNPNAVISTENPIHGNSLQGTSTPMKQNSWQGEGKAVASSQCLAPKEQSSEGVNFMDVAQNRQLVIQQATQPAAAGNFLHVPAFIYPVSQQKEAASNQPGPPNSAVTSTQSPLVSASSTAALPATSPAVSEAMSHNFPYMAGKETPYLTILPNNGYPMSVPTPIGSAPAISGGTHAQALPFFNGSIYSSQYFHPSQLQYQQQPLRQSSHQKTNASTVSSLSHKQLSQQPRGMPVSGSKFVSSMSMQSEQMQKQHVIQSNQSRKPEADSGHNISSAADSRLSHSQTSLYVPNYSVPFQTLNFTLMPSSAVIGGSTGGTHNEKQQKSQQKIVKGGVERMPQAFPMSFASLSGGNSPPNLNFSALQHNPAIVQSLPDMARQGYQILPAVQAMPLKNNQITELKIGGGSSNHDEGKKPVLGKSSATNIQTLAFDDSSRTLNFVSSPITGGWPSRSIMSTGITANAANSHNFQPQQQLQPQKQQMLKQQQSAGQSKAQMSNCLPPSSTSHMFPQILVQSNSSSQSPQWKNSAKSPTNQVPMTSLTSSSPSTSNIKNVSHRRVRSPQGQTQICFERHPKSSVAPQSSSAPNKAGKAGSTITPLPAQQADNSSASSGQKSSPVCGRNAPSILSTCPGHLSELNHLNLAT